MLRRLPLLLLASLALPASARADGEVTLRGNYWRDRNTRVIAPEACVRKEIGDTTVEGGYLLDAITSASAAAGSGSDQPFTELRHQIGVGLAQRLGPATVAAQYRYSTESDYWAHTAGGTLSLDLAQHNTALAASYFYGHADAGMRRGALGLIPAAGTEELSVLQSHFVILSASQVLARWALLDGSYELGVLDGYQANPYRQVKVSGTATAEVVPRERQRHALAAGLRLLPWRRDRMYLATYLRYRFYVDDWGIVAHTPEARLYFGVGPWELRLTERVYTQGAADFFRANAQTGLAEYASGGVMFHDCPTTTGCYTGDAKMSPFDSVFTELRAQLALRFLDRPKVPLGHWLGASLLAVSFGYYWNDGYAYAQYGNAYVGGFELTMPL